MYPQCPLSKIGTDPSTCLSDQGEHLPSEGWAEWLHDKVTLHPLILDDAMWSLHLSKVETWARSEQEICNYAAPANVNKHSISPFNSEGGQYFLLSLSWVFITKSINLKKRNSKQILLQNLMSSQLYRDFQHVSFRIVRALAWICVLSDEVI